jgi:hypothetical protein
MVQGKRKVGRPPQLADEKAAMYVDRHVLIIPARGPASAATHHHTGGPQAKAGSRPYLFGTGDGGLGSYNDFLHARWRL